MQRQTRIHLTVSAILLALCAMVANPAHAQTAYFSAQGEIVAVGDQYEFFLTPNRQISAPENLSFRTWTHAGGTNAAGDVIAATNFDGELRLKGAFSGIDVENDDGGIGNDAWLAFFGIAANGGVLPSPIENQLHTLTVRHFNDTNVGLFAVDLVGPADALDYSGQLAIGTARLDSLKFGTTGVGSETALYNVGSTNAQIDGDVVVAQTGTATLLLENSIDSLTAGGLITVNSGGTATLNNGTLNANGGLLLDGGTLTRSAAATLNLGDDQTLTVNNGGMANVTGNFKIGRSDVVNSIALSFDNTAIIDGTGSNLTVSGTTALGEFSTGTLTVRNAATASLQNVRVSGDGIFPFSSGQFNVFSGGSVTATDVTVGTGSSGSTASLSISGTGSSLTQTGSSTLSVGSFKTSPGTVTVTDGGSLTTGTGTTNINKSGSLTVDANSTFTANGDITVDGGTFSHNNVGLFLWTGAGKNLLATNDGQVQTTSANLFISADQTATINSGADWTHTGNLISGTQFGNGTITVDGDGSTLNVSGQFELTSSGNRGVVNVQNNAQATSGELGIGRSNPNATTDAELNINTGGSLTTDTIVVGEVDGSPGMGTINLDGLGSTLTQTGASFLNLGNADTPGNNGVHAINVTNNAVFTTGTGTTNIYKTGTLTLNTGGTFNANGNVNINSGTLRSETTGVANFNLAAGKTLTANAGSTVAFDNGTYRLNNGTTFNINDSELSTAGLLTVGAQSNGTLNVDNGDLNVGTAALIGGGGGTGTVDISNATTATFGGNLEIAELAGLSTSGTVGRLTVDGSQASSGNLTIATQAPASGGTAPDGELNVTGNGATFTQTGASSLSLGQDATTGRAVLNVTNEGSFTTGTGNTTIDKTGTLTIDGTSTFNANGDITVDGGTFSHNNLGQILLTGAGKNLLATNGGQVQTTSNLGLFIFADQTATINSGADWNHTGILIAGSTNGNGTITVDGTGSTLNVSDILSLTSGGNRGVVNVQNNASATFGVLSIGRSNANSTTDAELNINTGGSLTTGSTLVGELDGSRGTGTINLDGLGSTLTLTGASFLALGNADTPGNNGVHAINVTNDAVFTTGTGTTTIGNTGTLTVNTGGDFNVLGDFATTGTIDYELQSLSSFEGIQVDGAATLGGELRVGTSLSFTPSIGETFELLRADGGITGTFDFRSFLRVPNGLDYDLQYTPNSVLLAVSGVGGILGDFDNDGDVDTDDIDFYSDNIGESATGELAQLNLDDDQIVTLADHDLHITTLVQDANGTGALIGDLNLDGDVDVSQISFVNGQVVNSGDASVLLASLGSTSGQLYADGDLNADGDVDITQILFVNGQVVNVGDASRLLANLSQSTGTATATSSAVPEPGSLILLALAGAGVCCVRRRQA